MAPALLGILVGTPASAAEDRAMERARVGQGTLLSSDSGGEVLRWHDALCRGYSKAGDWLAAYLVPVLTRRLRRKWRGWTAALIDDGVEDTVLHYLAHPYIFDPARGTLETFLSHGANQRVETRLRSALRRLRHECCAGEVALDALARSTPGRLADPPAFQAGGRNPVRMLLTLTRTDGERSFLEMRLNGASIADQAMALGLESLPLADQRVGIQRVMTRLRERARRRGWRRDS